MYKEFDFYDNFNTPEIKISNYIKEYRRTGNTIKAYTNIVDCSNKSISQIEANSYAILDICFEEIFFVKNENTKSFLKNTGKVFGVIFSLGGSYTLELQKKHYSDLYECLYLPTFNKLKILQSQTNHELVEIGKLFNSYNKLLVKGEKILNKTSSNGFFIENNKTITLEYIHKFNIGYKEALTTGFGGLVGGSAAIGAWGVVSIIGSASTGTAISTLSGIASTNATLAWFGGGSLATGGAGILGGFWVITGIVAAPMIYFSIKSSYKKASAVKEEKFKLISELEKLIKLKIDAQNHLEKLILKRTQLSNFSNYLLPKLEMSIKAFDSHSSLRYRIFGGKLNKEQKDASKTIDNLINEGLRTLGFI